MKDAIDHVLPWIKRDICGPELAEIVAKEVGEPIAIVTFKLKVKGVYDDRLTPPPMNEIDLVPPANRRGRDVTHMRNYRGNVV